MWKTVVVVLTSLLLSTSLSKGELLANANEENGISTLASTSSPLPTSIASEPVQSSTPSLLHSSEPAVVVTSLSPIEDNAEKEETSTPRRQITYDQRQDGQYNIRADLENFMIIVIPSNPRGMGLLDLLAESALTRSNAKKVPKKHKPISDKLGLRKNDDFKFGSYFQRPQQRQSIDTPLLRTNEFIEGRTPYSVDISSSEGDIGHSHGNAQLDMIPPPPYPIQFHHIAPVEGYSASPHGKLLELFNRFSERRFPKAISDHPIDIKELQTNRVLSLNDGRSYSNKHDLDKESEELNSQKNSYNPRTTYVELAGTGALPLDLNNDGRYETRSVAVSSPIDRNWELKLLGASEQCGPGRRRNSYGICQFVPDIN